MNVLGIDVSKNDLHVAYLCDTRSVAKIFHNSPAGFTQLCRWLRIRGVEPVHACLESTGGWSESVALALHNGGHVVSIVNPVRIKAFAQSEMIRTKTDGIDAATIARFCRLHHPDRWIPLPQENLELQGLVRRRECLIKMRVEEQNRLSAPTTTKSITRSLRTIIANVSKELKLIEMEIRRTVRSSASLAKQCELLTSIPGIAEITAARILSEMPRIAEFRDSKAVAAFAGLSPRHHQSGSMRLPSRLAKAGNAELRKALYFPAIVAMQHNAILRQFVARLKERGKVKMTVIAAVMRKLLTLAYGVLKSGQPFTSNYVTH
jgi:transposase